MKNLQSIILMSVLILLMLSAGCVSTQTKMAGQGSSIDKAANHIADKINETFNLESKQIQISPNNFWEKQTKINLPFSSLLYDALSLSLSKKGALLSMQEVDENPVQMLGSYTIAGGHVIVTVRLRKMGLSSSTDIIVTQASIKKATLDPKWLTPKFDRMAKTLVRLLESNFHGFSAISVHTKPLTFGPSFQEELCIGKQMQLHINDAMASSPIFLPRAVSDKTDAELTGSYTKSKDNISFHISVKNIKLGQTICGASFETPINTIPQELLQPGIKSIDDLAKSISGKLIQQYQQKNKTITIYAGKNGFYNQTLQAVTLFEKRIIEKIKNNLEKQSFFQFTDNASSNVDMILTGTTFMDNSIVDVSASLKTVSKNNIKTIVSASSKIKQEYCKNEWFNTDLRAKTDYLMQQLETKSMSTLAGKNKSELVINRFKYENSKLYSKFSDYIREYSLDYFSGSRFLTPVIDIEERLTKVSTRGLRTVIATKKEEAQVAAAADVSHYISGSYWELDNGNIEIKASLSNIKGTILASDHIIVDSDMVNASLLTLPQKKDQTFLNNINQVSATDSNKALDVQLFTQKGRNSLIFNRGEEITFFIKANKNVYIQLFSQDAAGNIYRIYPNSYVSSNQMINAGVLTSIPNNTYASDFKFKVAGQTGNEMVFAFAASSPLPDLPSQDTGFYGMMQMSITIPEMKQKFTNFALRRGISLSWDVLPIVTR